MKRGSHPTIFYRRSKMKSDVLTAITHQQAEVYFARVTIYRPFIQAYIKGASLKLEFNEGYLIE
jgi:hypothetical protein